MVKKIDYFSLFARIAIALGFLSAVADRLGLWTPLLGSENVVWEIILGILLLIGFQKRLVALLSGILLLTFAFSMLFSLNIKAPLDYSVFAATACAFLLYKENGTKISPASQRTSQNAI